MKFQRSEIKNENIWFFCNLMPDMAVGQAFNESSYQCFMRILEFTGIFDINEGDILPNNLVECNCYAYSIRKYQFDSGCTYLIKDDLSESEIRIIADKEKVVNQISFCTYLF